MKPAERQNKKHKLLFKEAENRKDRPQKNGVTEKNPYPFTVYYIIYFSV